MSEFDSTPADAADKPTKKNKPAKPFPKFPLGYHPSGYWCKKIRGKLHYFGPRFNSADPAATAVAAEEALEEYNRQAVALHAGRVPRPDTGTATVKELVNSFLNTKSALVESGELSKLTWGYYKTACDEIITSFGKGRLLADVGPDDFTPLRKKMAAKWGPHRLLKTIQFIRCVFKFAFESKQVDSPVCFGPDFKRPSPKWMRHNRAEKGPKLFSREELRKILDAAGVPIKAFVLLGLNCAFGNSDCGNLPMTAIDFDRGIIDFPRPKTGIHRRCVLWPETIEAIKSAIEKRPTPKKAKHDRLVFLTRCGDSWHTGTTDGPISCEFGKLLKRFGIMGRKGLGFYALRHVFCTVADETKDQIACDTVMGHEVTSMSSVFRETISDERLRAVTDHVHDRLFAK